ncbi:efflux RND transporter periplasmic adaptor subunit [Cucumibacter marinus]|uniref:efflux RND transporter periplasmic adaptor subunit n=1 Tax=Cucumibacter marinus TaxID=1121252 RepID=UPI000409C5B5|nr:efflux RND transporter periplasmic adaptor subunit [Cucumibacter marinus]
MRAILSYAIALIIIVVVGAWLLSGTLVAGGKGPGNGEQPAINLLSGGEDSDGLAASGIAPEEGDDSAAQDNAEKDHAAADGGENAGEEHEGGIDPTLTIAERNAQNGGEEAEARSVRTETFTIRPLALDVNLRGRTKASAEVTVTSETSGIVETVHVEKGQSVAVGDPICTLDKGTRQAAVDQAEAGLAQAQLEYETTKSLIDKDLAPVNSAKAVEAALRSAEAALKNAKAELDRTEILAEVSGIVQAPLADKGSMLSPGSPCATIVELDPMLFVGSIPEARIGLAHSGLDATVTTVTGDTVEGKVSYVASTADNATRSFAFEIELPNPDGKLKDGLTAEAEVNLGTIPAHLLPQSVLTLDDDGVLGVRAVKDNVVEFYPITIARDTREGVWVTGLPASVDIITIGQEFVKAGQSVDATNVAAAPAADETSSQG